MAEKAFRVLLDLNDLQIESLKYVWMNVSPQELNTISDFKTLVVHKINLEKISIKLFLRNGLLLDDETIMILREDDTLKVQYEDQYHSDSNCEYSARESRKTSRKRNRCSSHSDLVLNAKKFKTVGKILTHENEENCDEVNKKKKKKHKQSHSVNSENLCNQSITFEDNCSTEKSCKKKDEKEITQLEKKSSDLNLLQNSDSFFLCDSQGNAFEENKKNISNTAINSESSSYLKLDPANDALLCSSEPGKELKKLVDINNEMMKTSDGLGNNCPKKKRKRHRKRKQVLETVVNTCDNTDMNSEFKSFLNDNNESVQRKHILYSSSPCKEQENIQLDCNDKSEVISSVKSLYKTKDTFIMDKSTSDLTGEDSNNHPKVSTPTQSANCENPNWCLSLMQISNLSSHCNGTEEFKNRKNKSYIHTKRNFPHEQNVPIENIKNEEKSPKLCYTDLPTLNSRPDIGTRIAYKVLELDEHYSPVISDYRVGIVKSINLDNEEMEIELLKHEVKRGRTGKFENLIEDEIPPPEIITSDTVRWSSMVEPKLYIC